ncbi:MAG: FAD:protein FMN transferase [Bacteroidia bacterium]
MKTLETNYFLIKPYLFVKAAFIAALLFLMGCGQNQVTYYSIAGETMGTTYHISYEGSNPTKLKQEIDDLLISVNQSLSTYIPSSTISKINSNESTKTDSRFTEVFEMAKEVNKNTEGAFDPTVGPLVNAWGFGFENANKVDSNLVDSLMNFVGFDLVSLTNSEIKKVDNNVIIDFSAIAKGYGVDIVAQLLNEKAIKNYMIEIGGEVYVKGENKEKSTWKLGINTPEEGSNNIFAIAAINNGALATSGNYRNFKVVNGQKYVHTINPKTGYGVMSKLLSASVFTNNCALADAYATAFMVMGVEKSIEIAKNLDGVELYLIYLNEKNQLTTYSSIGMKDKVKVAF